MGGFSPGLRRARLEGGVKETVHCWNCRAPIAVELPEPEEPREEWSVWGFPLACSSNPRFYFCRECVEDAEKEQAARKERKRRSKERRRKARRRGR